MSISRDKDISGIFARTVLAITLIVAIAAFFVTQLVSERAASFQKLIEHNMVLRGSDAVALSFNTAFTREWDSIHAVAKSIDTMSQADLDHFTDAVAKTGGQVAWAGFATPDGTIRSGSNRIGEGDNVSSKNWFRDGLRAPSISRILETASALNPETGLHEKYLNLSTPVFSAGGQTLGVVMYRLRIEWVKSFLLNASHKLGIDVIVQDDEGNSIVDTRGIRHVLPSNLVSAAAVRSKTSDAFHFVQGSDGSAYAFTSSFIWDHLPDFGWRVFAVLRDENMSSALPALTKDTLWIVGIAAIAMLTVTFVCLRLLLHPIERLAHAAKSLADGKLVFPDEATSSREAISLSSALAIIQSQMISLRNSVERTTTRQANRIPQANWLSKSNLSNGETMPTSSDSANQVRTRVIAAS